MIDLILRLDAFKFLPHLFHYITFRAAAAAITAFVLSLILGGGLIRFLKRVRAAERVEKTDSAELGRLHSAKASTPTMGGLLVLLAVLGSTLLWARLVPLALLALFATAALGLVGFYDDFIKLTVPGKKGLSKRAKSGMQVVVGLIVGLGLLWIARSDSAGGDLRLHFPFVKSLSIDLGGLWGAPYVALAVLVMVSSSNAVNLTDGLDGLAIGCTVMVALAFAPIAYVVGRADYSSYLLIPHVANAGELAVFASALVGGGMGFLWFNCFPAEIFMGDTGSLPLGGALGYLALAVRHEVLLALVGGIFVVEALSVILQVFSFRVFGRRIFRIAPIHHHFQFAGCPESKITVRFWIISAILALFSVATLKVR
ncbi:MAG: phospho-N-acetylmuramoyl-pentapeptide-transferase [Planctomycetes bacterium]|nr:phospho-N-acetylmuramoyl-pentapeptide-transferase [Planctomycetota bacterium]MBI3847012.1 phospho-N-acetylmuramoyl-pentapeptide-transferase [Planctomycetota bacterium]